MEIIIHVFSKKIDKDFDAATSEYVKRTSPYCKIKLNRYKKASTPTLSKNSYVFLVNAGEDTLSSNELADKINDICISGYSCIEFIIADGLILDDLTTNSFNLSSFDMSNELTVVALTEQIYRAYTIQNNITYHK